MLFFRLFVAIVLYMYIVVMYIYVESDYDIAHVGFEPNTRSKLFSGVHGRTSSGQSFISAASRGWLNRNTVVEPN